MNNRAYRTLKRKAIRKGWKVPSENDPFSKETWFNYWKGCEMYELEPNFGRPVAPHRIGR